MSEPQLHCINKAIFMLIMMAALQANVVQANMLNSQTKAALLQLEVEQSDDEHGIASITAHIWRAEMLTGVLEVDKDQLITKSGCCVLHQPGVWGMLGMFV